MDIQSKTIDGSTSEGLIIPRVTGNALHTAETAGVYGADQDATLAFVTAPPDPANRTGQVEGMDSRGFYYFDSGTNRWVKISSGGTVTAGVTQLSCSGASNIGVLESGEAAAGINTIIPYTGGNGGVYSGISVPSSGVTGLTATLSSGTLNNGNGNLDFAITGTPSAAGTAVFTITLAGETCGFTRTVAASSSFPDILPVVINGQTRQMRTYNLGADTSLDPNVPVQAIMGNYYQWGRSTPAATAYVSSGNISGWNTSAAADKAWNSGTEAVPVKTANDPCPAGFRVPTRNEWTAFNASSTSSNIGTWAVNISGGSSNFGAAKVFVNNGSTLTFPTAGFREKDFGGLNYRAYNSYYWSNTEKDADAYSMYILFGSINTATSMIRKYGFSVRCINQ
ncbi:fibrobacter succinogenes major paralogous domain-containing protein [Chryseobacterium sp. ISL-6]|uniref:fibrobacter succinogenes major paralogous domain-containing protein n=1 Tax=Chryseobacterium sp. ISL-6 TaxID=2819143 RepID=UPI001BEA9880|nr:fibrobacter succinogenes major paralogous domain-containing protein [Chryseobacterium sp. ISL-6]MBT2620604.1 hypothetical protein [Chryseobacterium sp. ISL-6]